MWTRVRAVSSERPILGPYVTLTSGGGVVPAMAREGGGGTLTAALLLQTVTSLSRATEVNTDQGTREGRKEKSLWENLWFWATNNTRRNF